MEKGTVHAVLFTVLFTGTVHALFTSAVHTHCSLKCSYRGTVHAGTVHTVLFTLY